MHGQFPGSPPQPIRRVFLKGLSDKRDLLFIRQSAKPGGALTWPDMPQAQLSAHHSSQAGRSTHRQGHCVVEVHRPHPHADAGAGLRDLGHCLWRELLHGHVRLNLLDDGIRDVVPVKSEEAVQELVGVIEKLLAGLPVVGNLLACTQFRVLLVMLTLSTLTYSASVRSGQLLQQTAVQLHGRKRCDCSHERNWIQRVNACFRLQLCPVLTHLVGVVLHLGLLIKHDAGRLHDQLHTRRWVLQAAHFNNVIPAQVFEAGQGSVQCREGSVQLTLGIICMAGDTVRSQDLGCVAGSQYGTQCCCWAHGKHSSPRGIAQSAAKEAHQVFHKRLLP